jgi:hypothetical protein
LEIARKQALGHCDGHLERSGALNEVEWDGSDRFANLDSASGSEVPAFFSLTPVFSPVDTPHSAQLSRFNGFRILTTQATQHSTDIAFDAKPLKRLTSISCGESPA